MWFTPRRAQGVRDLALAAIYVVSLALAISFSVNGWASFRWSDLTSPIGLVSNIIIIALIVSGIRKLR